MPDRPVPVAPARDPDEACSRDPRDPPDLVEDVDGAPDDDTPQPPPDEDGPQLVAGDAEP